MFDKIIVELSIKTTLEVLIVSLTVIFGRICPYIVNTTKFAVTARLSSDTM